MRDVPEGGIPEEEKRKVPTVYYEGPEEVKLSGKQRRPGGRSEDPDNIYFWKMSKDKKTIDVVFPIDDSLAQKDIVYRLGEDPEDVRRGPTLEMGWRYRNERGRFREHLVLDGQILNAINRKDCYWTIEEMAGVKVCILTLARPTMMRERHDPILKRATQEERIEPQTWDALLVEERFKPKPTETVFFDIESKGEHVGRLEFGLYGKDLPRTVKNFVGLTTGEFVDDDGELAKSAHCFKGSRFTQILPGFLISGGNPGLDLVRIDFNHEELKEYAAFYEDFRVTPRKVGKVERSWAIRWGADLGLPVAEDGTQKREGQAVDGNSENELSIVVETMQELVEKGEGAEFIFFRPQWEKGCDIKGGTFPAESMKVKHFKRGLLSMDRNVDMDRQGSNFFITLKEFPEMDERWVCFGEVTDGWDVIERLEADYDGVTDQVIVADCGLVE